MSEPHELEERAEIAWSAERQKWLISGDGERVFSLDDAGMDDPPRFTGLRSECEAFVRAYCLRAVLALVQKEQETKLIKALEPFADIDGEGDEDFTDDTRVTVMFGRTTSYSLTLGDFRKARHALSHTAPQEK